MNKPYTVAAVAFCLIFLNGCFLIPTNHIKMVNGFATNTHCDQTLARTGQTTKITLPSISSSGVTLNLGNLETDPKTTASITSAVVTCEDAIVGFCNQMNMAAAMKDAVTYNKCRDIQIENLTKLQQLAAILAFNPPAETAKTPATPAKSAATAELATPAKPKSQKLVMAEKWLAAYGPASVHLAKPEDVAFTKTALQLHYVKDAKSLEAAKTTAKVEDMNLLMNTNLTVPQVKKMIPSFQKVDDASLIAIPSKGDSTLGIAK